MTTAESTEIVVISSPLSLVSALSAEDILEGFVPASEWRYSFNKSGAAIQGLTADGIQDGVRQMSRKGEAIRCIDVRLEKDDDDYAYFIAHAGRYAISPDGQEVLLDSTIRGKRVAKKGNEFWWEQGLTKAARNAEEALMPEALKQWMVAKSAELASGAPSRTQAPRPQQAAPRPSTQPTRQRAPLGTPEPPSPNHYGPQANTPAPSDENAKPPADWKPSATNACSMGGEHEPKMDMLGATVCTKCGDILA